MDRFTSWGKLKTKINVAYFGFFAKISSRKLRCVTYNLRKTYYKFVQ